MKRQNVELLNSNIEEREYVKFHLYDLPLASSMADLYRKSEHPFQKFFCLWTTFNHIYARITDIKQPIENRGMNLQKSNGKTQGLRIRKTRVLEREQIRSAISELDTPSRNTLIWENNVEYFVNRSPCKGYREFDDHGVLINGVLNVAETSDYYHPVFSPIDKKAYIDYLRGNLTNQALLANQIVEVIYTIRNNLFHGRKDANEYEDCEVVMHGIPILLKIVGSYISGCQIEDVFTK